MKKILIASLLFLGYFTSYSQEVIHLDDASFKEKVWDYEKNKDWVYEGDVPAVIDFYADWCAPCRMIAPHLKSLQSEYGKKIQVYKVNVDKHKNLARLFGVRSIPTLIYAPTKGKFVTKVGGRDKSGLKRDIDKHLMQ